MRVARRTTATDLSLRIGMLAIGLMALGACAPRVTSPPLTTQRPPPPVAEAPPPAAPVDPRTRVAVLLPLSGQGGQIGTALLDAAQLAVFDTADEDFVLLSRDTRGTPAGAAEAIRAAVDGGARLVVGPLFAAEVQEVAGIARSARVPVIALSSDRAVARDGVWVFGFTPGEQVARVAAHAVAQGVRRIALIASAGPYGDQVEAALRATLDRTGGTLVRSGRLEGTGAQEVRAGIASALDRPAILGPGGDMAIRQALAEPDFDALMIAEGGPRLREVAGQLASLGLQPGRLRILGTGLWDEPGLGREPLLAGGWYAAPDPSARQAFETRYAAVYGRRPPRIGTIAFDAVQLAAVLSRGPSPIGLAPETIMAPDGFAGVDGIFRFRPGGQVDRGLAVIEVTPEGSTIVDPAPQTFVPTLF
jgi:ABC-type branched-subunit amino acid transport system substrate-binding protein